MTVINTGTGIMKAGGGIGKTGRSLGYKFGINRTRPLSAAQPPVVATIERISGSADASGNMISWEYVETARGVYTWTAFDALVADAQSRGADIVYTFTGVPPWANGGASADVPPTSFSDFYTFATAVVQRYAGRIRYYEAWNEPDLGGSSQYWSGTVAQMVTLATQVYAIVHANDPAALACTPCVSGGIGAPWSSGATANGAGGAWLDAFLAAGGGVGADVAAVHVYATVSYGGTPNADPPEQVWWTLTWMRNVFAAYGLGGLPLLATEGSWGTNTTASGHVFSTAETQAWGAVWPALMVSGGVDRLLWYASDSSLWATLFASGALTPGGQAYVQMCAWLEGATFSAPIARQAGTNAVANPNGAGVVAGSTPTGWSIGDPDVWGGYGMNYSFPGYGPNGGVLFRYYGTATAGAGGYVVLSAATAGAIAAAPNQYWTFGCTARVAAGSLANVSEIALEVMADNSGGSFSSTQMDLGVTLTGTMNLLAFSLKITDANAASVLPGLMIYYPVGKAVDVTLEIIGCFADTGSIWSGDIARPGGYQGRILWDAAGGPTTYTVPGWATYYRDVTGALHSITGGTVTLTNLPILLENQGR